MGLARRWERRVRNVTFGGPAGLFEIICVHGLVPFFLVIQRERIGYPSQMRRPEWY